MEIVCASRTERRAFRCLADEIYMQKHREESDKDGSPARYYCSKMRFAAI